FSLHPENQPTNFPMEACMKCKLGLFASLSLLLTLTASLAFGQAVTGSIVGNVTDSGGAAVAGAKVTITETSTGIAHTATTNEDGVYVMPYLPPGAFKVEIERQGFKKYSRDGVRLATGERVRVNAELAVGNVNETVEVTTQAPLLQTESADVSQAFEA